MWLVVQAFHVSAIHWPNASPFVPKGRAELADTYRGGAHPTVNATCSNVPEALCVDWDLPVLVEIALVGHLLICV